MVAVGKGGVFKVGPLEKSAGEVRLVEVSLLQAGVGQVCPGEINRLEVCALQVGLLQICPGEIGPFQKGAGKLCPAQISAGEIAFHTAVGGFQGLKVFFVVGRGLAG